MGSDPITKFLRCGVGRQEEVVQVDDLGDGGGDAVEDLLFEGDAVGVERAFVAVLEEDDELLLAEDEEREEEPRESFCISALNSPKEAASLSIAVATAQSSLLFSMMVLLLP